MRMPITLSIWNKRIFFWTSKLHHPSKFLFSQKSSKVSKLDRQRERKWCETLKEIGFHFQYLVTVNISSKKCHILTFLDCLKISNISIHLMTRCLKIVNICLIWTFSPKFARKWQFFCLYGSQSLKMILFWDFQTKWSGTFWEKLFKLHVGLFVAFLKHLCALVLMNRSSLSPWYRN